MPIEAWLDPPSMPIAPRLEACPACNFELDLKRPSFTCPACGQDLTQTEER